MTIEEACAAVRVSVLGRVVADGAACRPERRGHVFAQARRAPSSAIVSLTSRAVRLDVSGAAAFALFWYQVFGHDGPFVVDCIHRRGAWNTLRGDAGGPMP